MSEKFALKWDDFQSNWNQSMSHLRNDTDFDDVTLISDDKMKFSAHKILLSSCSNTFKMILKENKNSKSLLYLGGVSSVNIGYILDYIYHGEVNLYQEQLESFLESAKNLEIEGLMGQESITQNSPYENNEVIHQQEEQIVFPMAKHLVRMNDNNKVIQRRKYGRPTSSEVVAKIDVTSYNSEQIEEKIKELYEKIEEIWFCTFCDYTTTTNSSNIRRHVERHIDGLSYNCYLCNKEFRSRDILSKHKYTHHK